MAGHTSLIGSVVTKNNLNQKNESQSVIQNQSSELKLPNGKVRSKKGTKKRRKKHGRSKSQNQIMLLDLESINENSAMFNGERSGDSKDLKNMAEHDE